MKRSAFTLVELLIVIVIIGMLASLLIVGLQGARETARRNRCISQQRSLAQAMIAYSNKYDGLPGYLNQQGTMPVHSWAVALFPLIYEETRHKRLIEGVPPAEALVSPAALLCPSDNPRETSRLNYVVNCGPVPGEIADAAATLELTLFQDRRAASKAANKKVKIEDIPNGAGNTILLSENVDAGVWFRANWTTLSPTDAVKDLGFLWSPSGTAAYAPNSPPSSPPVPRPSSKHPGVVVVAYGDGRAEALSDNDDIAEYQKAVNCGTL
jgi:prepilin-type N-terminal cleavage/methylation domain-containing protein